MANDAYKVLADTSIPRPLRTSVNIEGVEIEEVSGQAYAAGDYVFAEELTARDRQRAEDGELDHLLDAVSREEAQEARTALVSGLHIPEHEVERYALLDAGHRVIERDQVLELRAAGAEAAREAVEASKKTLEDANPQITEQPSFVETPNLVDVSHGEVENVPTGGGGKQEKVSDYEVENALSASDAGVEMPPGLPVGPTLAKAEGADPEKVDEATEKSNKRTARRAKPGSSSSSGSTPSSGGSES